MAAWPGPIRYVLPEGATEPRTEGDHIKDVDPASRDHIKAGRGTNRDDIKGLRATGFLRALRCPAGAAARSARGRLARGDAIGIPVSVLSLGGSKAAARPPIPRTPEARASSMSRRMTEI